MASLVRHRTTLVAAVVALVSAIVPVAASAKPFAADSFWNAPLADGVPLDARSDAYVTDLQCQPSQWSPYINTTQYSTPVYTVAATQAKVRVALDLQWSAPDLQAAWEQVPIPAAAAPAAGTDGHMVVYQPATDTMWEFCVGRGAWGLARTILGWAHDRRLQEPGLLHEPVQLGRHRRPACHFSVGSNVRRAERGAH